MGTAPDAADDLLQAQMRVLAAQLAPAAQVERAQLIIIRQQSGGQITSIFSRKAALPLSRERLI
jgi:hypothetical protein